MDAVDPHPPPTPPPTPPFENASWKMQDAPAEDGDDYENDEIKDSASYKVHVRLLR